MPEICTLGHDQKKSILLLAFLTLTGFSLLGWGINYYFLENGHIAHFPGDAPVLIQLAVGIGYGGITAVIGWQIVRTKLLKPVRSFFSQLIRSFHLSGPEIIFISLCAGIGEEILFRGAIQPFLGVWITAVLFVAIHGYLNPLNWRLAIYGIYMTLIIAGLGYMTIHLGLVSAMAGHTAIDIVLLAALAQKEKEVPFQE